MGITAKITKQGSAEARIKELIKHTPTVRAGFLDGATYPNGQSVAYIAYINEYGRGHNPERPFMKNTVKENSKKWTNFIKAKLKGNLKRAEAIFKATGEIMRADIVDNIVNYNGINPTNKPATIEAKKRRQRSGKGTVGINPEQVLIDGKYQQMMSKSVSYEVTK